MGKNTGKGHRIGSVNDRTQFNHNNQWYKRDTETGRIISSSENKYKGTAEEKDGRREK